MVVGKMSLGKYTLVSSPAFARRQLLVSVNVEANKYQGITPAKTINP
jgi:hypothetical protein